MKKKKKQNNQATVNNSLLDIITPLGLELKRNSLIVGGNTGRIYGIVSTPKKSIMDGLLRLQIYLEQLSALHLFRLTMVNLFQDYQRV